MKLLKWWRLLLAGVVLNSTTQAQVSFGSRGLTIKAGVTMTMDSLVLSPATDQIITNNSLNTVYAASTGTGNPGINRVFTFAIPLQNYSGNVGMFYTDAELNGNNGPWLAITYTGNNTSWKGKGSSSASNYVQSTGIGFSGDSILKISAVNSTTYYTKSSGDITAVANWGCNPDGSGAAPPDFNNTLNTFFIGNRSGAVGLSQDWNVRGQTVVSSGIYLGIGAHRLTLNDLICNGAIGGDGSSTFKLKGTATSIHFTNTANELGSVIIDTNALLSLQDTLNISATGGILTVAPGGTLNTAGYLKLLSDSTGTARIGNVSGTINGEVNCMQYVHGGRRAYRFWSHPFNTYIPLSQIQTYIDITGIGGAANGFTTSASNASSAFRYNPLVGNSASPSDPGWRPFTSTYGGADSNGLQQFQGIRLFIRGAKGEGFGYGTYNPSPVTIGMHGVVNQGDISLPLTKGTGANQDFNMVGNPYPSPVDIGTIIYNAKRSGRITGAAFYVFIPTLGAAGQFLAVPIGTSAAIPYYIAAQTAFQVRAAHNGDSLDFKEANKSATISNNLMKGQPEYVCLKVYDNNYHLWDVLSLKFNEAAVDQEDDYDALKACGQDMNFYSLSSENHKLALDARPFDATKVIPLGIASPFAQEYIIKAESLNLPAGGNIYLHDKLLKQDVLLAPGTEYKFSVNNNKATQGDNRFELRMNSVSAQQAETPFQLSLSPNPATEEISVTFSVADDDEHIIRIMDMAGVCVTKTSLGRKASGNVTISLIGLAAGMYIAELNSAGNKITEKFIKE